MKSKFFFTIPIVAALIAGILGGVYVNSLDEPYDTSVAFVTVSLDQTKLQSEVSSFEILRAGEHFSDMVLGWTLDPSFTEEFMQTLGADGKTSYSTRRQERSNLIFEVTGPGVSEETGALFVDLLDTRLAEYNAATNAAYVFAAERETVIEGARSDFRIILGFMLLGGLLSTLLLTSWNYARSYRN